MPQALTVRSVETAKAGAARREIPDPLLPGLYLVVQTSGAKSWAVRYRFGGKPAKHTIGTYPAITLASAREMGAKALRAVAEGRDPREAKRAAHEAARIQSLGRDSFDVVARQFLDRHAKQNTREASWRETARILGFKPAPDEPGRWIATGNGVAALWGRRPLHELTRRDVLDLLDGCADRGAPIMANRTLAAVRKLFAWAASRDIVGASPCVGVSPPAIEKARARVLSDDELRLVWRACDKIGWPFGPLVQLLILTLQRRDEVAEMSRGELDLVQRRWVIPRERAKNDQEHEVALSPAALEIIERLPAVGKRRDGYVFTVTGETPVTGYSRAKRRIDAAILDLMREDAKDRSGKPAAKIKPLEHWTLHDLRRTGASGMARIGIDLPVIEKVLNHSSGSFRGVVGVYQRHTFTDEKRAALEAWGRFVQQIVTDKLAGNVVPLRG